MGRPRKTKRVTKLRTISLAEQKALLTLLSCAKLDLLPKFEELLPSTINTEAITPHAVVWADSGASYKFAAMNREYQVGLLQGDDLNAARE